VLVTTQLVFQACCSAAAFGASFARGGFAEDARGVYGGAVGLAGARGLLGTLTALSAAAAVPLADLLLLHAVLHAKGVTTLEYIQKMRGVKEERALAEAGLASLAEVAEGEREHLRRSTRVTLSPCEALRLEVAEGGDVTQPAKAKRGDAPAGPPASQLGCMSVRSGASRAARQGTRRGQVAPSGWARGWGHRSRKSHAASSVADGMAPVGSSRGGLNTEAHSNFDVVSTSRHPGTSYAKTPGRGGPRPPMPPPSDWAQGDRDDDVEFQSGRGAHSTLEDEPRPVESELAECLGRDLDEWKGAAGGTFPSGMSARCEGHAPGGGAVALSILGPDWMQSPHTMGLPGRLPDVEEGACDEQEERSSDRE